MSQLKEPLIKGSFTPQEANEMLNKLFSSKIHMHGVASFSSLIREGTECEQDNDRIKELKSSIENIKNHLSQLPPHTKVRVSCDVILHLYEED